MIFVFFNDTAATEIYTLSLHDALPIWGCCAGYVGERRVTPGAVLSAEGSHLVAVRGQCTDLGISKEGGVRERRGPKRKRSGCSGRGAEDLESALIGGVVCPGDPDRIVG